MPQYSSSLRSEVYMFGNASIEEIIQDLVLEAEFYKGATTPNPPVGAAILDSNGRVIGRGFHHKAGEAHAEINALRNCQQQGELFDASTMVVTLEPCSHFGRTPPCTRAIIETHIKKVIVGTLDPNPRVKGSGVEELRNKGIEVEVLQGNLQELSLIHI